MSTVRDTLVADSVERLFGAHVTPASRLRVEAGRFDTDLWQLVVEAGFDAVMATEAAGGSGLGWSDAYPILRGIGYWQAPLPLAETMVASMLASLAGFAIPDGPLTMVEARPEDRLEMTGDGCLVGTIHAVPWGRHVGAVLIGLADGRIALVHLDGTSAVTVLPHDNLAGLPLDTLLLDHARPQGLAANPLRMRRPVWTLGAVARSAMLVGALESVLEQSVRYAGDRVQFGKPIGRNQAIQQSLALMAGDVAAARIAALVAAADAPSAMDPHADPTAATFSAAVAKVRTGEAAARGAGIAHQVHGAIGFTHEHALQFATRRLWAWREEFGTDARWAAELGRAAIGRGGNDFWAAMTSKQLAL